MLIAFRDKVPCNDCDSMKRTWSGKIVTNKPRLVVVGGDAAGMSAASQVRRRREDWEIVVFERGDFTSYSA